MGIKGNRRSRRPETPPLGEEENRTRVDSAETGHITLTISNSNVERNIGESNLENHLIQPSQFSNEIQGWTDIFEQTNNDRIS